MRLCEGDMSKFLLAFVFVFVAMNSVYADEISFDDALRAVRNNCSGMSDKLLEIKKIAGISTAISAVGTVVGTGTVVTGVAKTVLDNASDNLDKQTLVLQRLESNPTSEDVSELSKLQNDLVEITHSKELKENVANVDWKDVSPEKMSEFVKSNGLAGSVQDLSEQADGISKIFGNVETGLMATAAATNIASAVVSGINKIDADFAAHIGACMGSVKLLASMKMQAKLDGNVSDEEIAVAEKIINACDKFNVEDIEKINIRATGATVSSSVGAVAGAAGAVTAGVANSDSVKVGDGKDKEKKLNTVSNVLSGVTTVASLTATVFNATQKAAAKRVIETAELCEESIK